MKESTVSASVFADADRFAKTRAARKFKRFTVQCRSLAKGMALALLVAGVVSPAAANDRFSLNLHSKQPRQFWVNFGGLSKHYENAERFNQNNFGFGIEYQLDSSKYLVLGEYQNSVHESTRYVGGAWMPLTIGHFKLGAIGGVADGYPKMRNGGFFPLVLPALSFETKGVGANLVLVPSVADKVSGCIALQLKYRFQ